MRNPFAPLVDLIRPKNQTTDDKWNGLFDAPFGALNILNATNDDYGNAYPNINAIGNRFFKIRPYGIDENGQRLKETPQAIKALSIPNQSMSGVDFRRAIALMTLVHNKTYILVWENKGGVAVPATETISPENIAGFTFLERVIETTINGRIAYQTSAQGMPVTYSDKQVMVIHDINPNDLSKGYSPAQSVRKWATLEDFAADYQNGFFKNGGVPSGQFLITAPTKKEYKDIVKEMKLKYGGASNNGTAMYSYVPNDPVTGKPAQASVTWVPFNVTNKDLALTDLLDKAEKKVDGAYGVSAFIRNMDEAPNFATAQVIERNFVENTVEPFTILRWGRIQHELNRITGGLGYAIGFDIELPNVQEEELAKAQTNQQNAVTVNLLIARGYTLPNIVQALDLPKRWLELETAGTPNEDDSIDDDSTTDDTPDPDDPMKQNAKKKDHSHDDWQLSSAEQEAWATQLEVPARQLLEKQVHRAQQEVGVSNQTEEERQDDEDETEFLDAMMATIVLILIAEGITQWEEGKALLINSGIDQDMGAYVVSPDAQDRYREYLKTVFNGYHGDTKKLIRETLASAQEQGLTIEQTKANLGTIIPNNEYRVKRLAVAEANRSYSIASVESMQQIDEKLEDYTVQQSMESTTGNPCPFCSSLIGVWRTVGKTMVELGATVEGTDGGVFVNNWDDNKGHDIHPNGHCEPVYRIVENVSGAVVGQ